MKKKAAKTKLEDLVRAAQAAGARVEVNLAPAQMPQRLPNDPEPVRLLLDESERCNQLGNDWLHAKAPNPVAADKLFHMGWAYALAGAWLRCRLKGEVGPEARKKP